jgi:hypothetical protein
MNTYLGTLKGTEPPGQIAEAVAEVAARTVSRDDAQPFRLHSETPTAPVNRATCKAKW